jgi:hypothetical protein
MIFLFYFSMKIEAKNKRNKVILNKEPLKIFKKIFNLKKYGHDPEFGHLFNGDDYISLLKYVKNQTEEICLIAVEYEGFMLEYVKNQTEKICLAAVKEFGFALRLVERQTEEICLAALKEDPNSICFVKIKLNHHVTEYTKERTKKICLGETVIKKSDIYYINIQTNGFYLAGANKDNLTYIKEQTPEIPVKQQNWPSLYIGD